MLEDMRKLLIAALVLVVLGVLFWLFAARGVDRVLNRTGGFSASQASDRAKALAATLRMVDLHADTLLWGRDLNERAGHGHVDVPRLALGNVAIQAFTVVTKVPRTMKLEHNADDADLISLLSSAAGWPDGARASLKARAVYQAALLHEAAARSGGRLSVLRSAKDVEGFLSRRTGDPTLVGGFLGFEGAQCLEGDLANLDALYDAGFRMGAPTHFTDTEVAGSAHGLTLAGLSPLGFAWVKKMEEKKMLIDLAHASPKAIDDILKVATRPVVVSHTGVKATCDNARNLSNDHLRAIAKTGGVVGIAYFKAAICGTSPLAIARAIGHTVRTIGAEHTALGSDFDGAVATPFDTTGLPLVVDALLAEGLTEDQIRLVMGESTLRVLQAGLP
jgi:microsomal dipeptidase-like Zn-dependent dipeptidase